MVTFTEKQTNDEVKKFDSKQKSESRKLAQEIHKILFDYIDEDSMNDDNSDYNKSLDRCRKKLEDLLKPHNNSVSYYYSHYLLGLALRYVLTERNLRRDLPELRDKFYDYILLATNDILGLHIRIDGIESE